MSKILLLLLWVIAPATVSAQQVDIRLRAPSVSCIRKTIRIQDIAELSGGSPYVRQQLASLDLDEFSDTRTSLLITSELVHYRALLAGFETSQFSLTGGAQLTVNFATPANATQRIEQTLLEQLATRFQIPIDSLEMQLLTPLDAILNQSRLDLTTLTVSPQFPVELPLGNRTIELNLSDAAGRAHTTNVSLKISVYRDLVMAKQNISRGEMLAEDKLERVRRPIDSPQVSYASFEQVVGKKAQNNIQQFSLVKAQFVRDNNSSTAPAAYDVKRNGIVSVVIRRGPLVVTLKDARANDNGRVGDYINFTNPKSQETLRARIVDATTAIIEL